MLPDSALKSMRVVFATPCCISGVSMNYVASIFSLAHAALADPKLKLRLADLGSSVAGGSAADTGGGLRRKPKNGAARSPTR